MEDDTAGQDLPHVSEHEATPVSVTLTPGQVDQVVRAAVGAGNMSVLLSGLADIEETLARKPELLDHDRTSRSLLIGLLVIAALPSDGTYIGLTELSKKLDTSPSTVHRYVTTLVFVGLAERHPTTREYRLGR